MPRRLLLVLLLLSCGCSPEPRLSPEGIARSDDGWLQGDLHLHTTWSDGWDDTAIVIGLAESLESERFLAAHPEYQCNRLDFIAITDHRTIAVQDDPAWMSDRLILLGGEEFGTTGHANCIGVTGLVHHDPDGDGTTLEDILAAVDATHAQGAVFSTNHPLLPDIPWPWDTRNHDALEVWNAGWALMSPSFTPEDLQAWESSHGPASPLFLRATQCQGRSSSMQALIWYEAQLARGVHLALVGGSDRHTILLPGFPTTWVRADTADQDGLLRGIRARHTFVSRTPASTQILLQVKLGGRTFQLGDQVPVLATGAVATITVRVGRGDGGLLRLVAGEAVETDAKLPNAPLGSVVLERTVVGDDFRVKTALPVRPGSWFYPVVLDTLIRPDLTTQQEDLVREVAASAAASSGEDFNALVALVVSLTDTEVLFDASKCDPRLWEPDGLNCIPADDDGLATFFVPDMLDRALNVVVEEDAITDFSMGAVGSAVLFVEK